MTTILVHQHSGYIQVERFAVCATCGWLGPDRSTKDAAQRDLDKHVASTGTPIEVTG